MGNPCYWPGHDVHFIQFKHYMRDLPAPRGRLIGLRRTGFVVHMGNGEVVEHECIHAERARAQFEARRLECWVSVSERHHILQMPRVKEADGRETQLTFSIRRTTEPETSSA